MEGNQSGRGLQCHAWLNAKNSRRSFDQSAKVLAQLSGVSLTWYTWIEQARDISASREVIDSLARVLRMESHERAHLFTLAGLVPPTDHTLHPNVHDTLRRLVDTLNPNPAYVINPWWDLLAYNDAYAALLGGLEDRPPGERNILWLVFNDRRTHNVLVDWHRSATTRCPVTRPSRTTT